MKKNLVVLALASVAILAGTSKTNAQLVSTGSSSEYQKDFIGEQNNISPKAIRSFNKAYGDANNENWEQIKDGFAARFTSNGIKNTIFFDKKGNWSGSIKHYGEQKLLRDIRHVVMSKYYEYTISHVQELETIDSDGIPTYLIALENKTQIKVVRVHAEEMEVWKEYDRTN